MATCLGPVLDFFNAPFTAALTGGLVGGGLTFFGVRRTIEHEKQKIRAAEEQELKTFCHAILTELETLSSRYKKAIGDQLKSHDATKPFLCIYPVYQDYFTVFTHNAHMIGRIQNRELRTKIVQAYIYAKGLLDSYQYNNGLVNAYTEFSKRAAHTQNNPYDVEQREYYLRQIIAYFPSLKSLDEDLERTIAFVINALQRYEE